MRWVQSAGRCLSAALVEPDNSTKNAFCFNKGESCSHFNVCFAGDYFYYFKSIMFVGYCYNNGTNQTTLNFSESIDEFRSSAYLAGPTTHQCSVPGQLPWGLEVFFSSKFFENFACAFEAGWHLILCY